MNYYHYKYDEVMKLDVPTFEYLSEAMYLVKAQDNLELKDIISYPHMTKDGQKSVHMSLKRRAETNEMRAEKATPVEQLKLAGISMGSISDVVKGT